MTLCEDGHDEIVYDSRNCPACELLKKISDLEDQVYELKEEIDVLKAEANLTTQGKEG